MQTDVTEMASQPYRLPIYNLRWSAIFAGLVVGVATNLFLVLLGAAAGLAAFDVSAGGDRSILLAASAWNTVSMVLAALAGGYIAARTSGLRRTPDGILHGVVAWGVTMLLSAILATSAAGATLGGLFATAAPRGAGDVVRSVDRGDRQAAIDELQSRLGLSPDQANRIVDQALIMAGREDAASPQGRAEAQQTVRTASIASGWLSAAILLSLLAAMGGGYLGARGTRRVGGEETRRRTTFAPGTVADMRME